MSRARAAPCRLLACALLARVLLACAVAAPLAAQSVRVTGTTNVQYVELRPFDRDSVPAGAAAGSGLLRQLEDGRVVRCLPGEDYCWDVRPGAMVSTVPVFHDLEASAWGMGRGLSLFAHLRARSVWGSGAALWPRGDDGLDLLAAYAELERSRVRLRLGRQWTVTGLGFYNFDGLSAAVRPLPPLSIEVYGGRSLVRGLNEPRTGGALAAIDALAAPDAGVLVGAHVRYRPSARLALSGLYQIDARGDRRAIQSELAVLDGVLLARRGSIEGSVELDAASSVVNEARLGVRSAPLGRVALHAEARRYRPYFELWTIWGAFSPVGFDEGRAGLTWADPTGRLVATGELAYRRYDAAAEAAPDALREDGWSLGSSVGWSPASAWRIEASYRTETGPGAARRDGRAGVTRQLGTGGSVSLQALAFQRLYEFRIDDGTVVGLGADAALPLSARTSVVATAALYRQVDHESAVRMDWTQRRGSVRLQWTLGPEPGVRPRAGALP